MTKKSCIIYDSWGKILCALPKEKAGELIQAICCHAFGEEPSEIDDATIAAIFEMVKDKMDEDAVAYHEKVERMNKNRKSDRSQKEVTQKSDRSHTEIRQTSDRNHTEVTLKSDRSQTEVMSVSDSVSVSDNNNTPISNDIGVRAKRASAFTPPSVDEVKAYCQERQNKVDPIRFVNFYESKGWMIGKNKMKDWKASVRTWEQEEKARSGTTKQKDRGMLQQDYDLAEIERVLIKNG